MKSECFSRGNPLSPEASPRQNRPEDPGRLAESRLAARLIDFALEAAAIGGHGQPSYSLPRSGPPHQAMLSMLCYAYGTGLINSREIERWLPHDPVLNYLATGWHPTWIEFSHFRRHHKQALIQCLARFLHLNSTGTIRISQTVQSMFPAPSGQDRLYPEFLLVAEEILLQAIRSDSFDLDE